MDNPPVTFPSEISMNGESNVPTAAVEDIPAQNGNQLVDPAALAPPVQTEDMQVDAPSGPTLEVPKPSVPELQEGRKRKLPATSEEALQILDKVAKYMTDRVNATVTSEMIGEIYVLAEGVFEGSKEEFLSKHSSWTELFLTERAAREKVKASIPAAKKAKKDVKTEKAEDSDDDGISEEKKRKREEISTKAKELRDVKKLLSETPREEEKILAKLEPLGLKLEEQRWDALAQKVEELLIENTKHRARLSNQIRRERLKKAKEAGEAAENSGDDEEAGSPPENKVSVLKKVRELVLDDVSNGDSGTPETLQELQQAVKGTRVLLGKLGQGYVAPQGRVKILESIKTELDQATKTTKKATPKPAPKPKPKESKPAKPSAAKVKEETPKPKKEGRKKQVVSTPTQQFRLSDLWVAEGSPPPLDEDTKIKISCLKRIRELALDDCVEPLPQHVREVAALEQQHQLLGPTAEDLIKDYQTKGPQTLLLAVKETIDRLEGFTAVPDKKALAQQARELERANREREEAEKKKRDMEEKAKKEEEERLKKEEALRKKEEEKEAKRKQREEEKLKREQERLAKKEAERLKKEEEKRKKEEEKNRETAPKVEDSTLEHPKNLPKLSYKLDIDADTMGETMRIYNFCWSFGRELQLTRFPFKLWVQALANFNESRIVEETFRTLVVLCEEDAEEQSTRLRGGTWMAEITSYLGSTVGMQQERRKAAQGKRPVKGRGRGKRVMSDTDDSSSEEDNENCKVCDKNNQAAKLLICDLCEGSYHTFCLDPPLKKVPSDDWFCPECSQGMKEEEAKKEEQAKAEEDEPKEVDPNEERIKEIYARSLELGRHNTFQNYGIDDRLFMLKYLVNLACSTEKVQDAVRANQGDISEQWKEFCAEKRELQETCAKEIKEMQGSGNEAKGKKKDGDEGDDEDDEKDAEGKGDDEGGEEEQEKKDGEPEKKKRKVETKEEKEKKAEEREKKKAEAVVIKNKYQEKIDALTLKFRLSLESIQMRTYPIGEDRFKRLYWRLPGDGARVWVQAVNGYSMEVSESTTNSTTPADGSDPKPEGEEAKEEPLVEEEEDEEEVPESTEWGTLSALDELLQALDDRGTRESKLKEKVKDLMWLDAQSPDRHNIPRHHQLRYYINRFKSNRLEKNPLEWN